MEDYKVHTDEDLEPPLPLKDEDEWEDHHQHHHTPTCRHSWYCTPLPQPCPHQHMNQTLNWMQHPDSIVSDSLVSVNVPLFSIPPVEQLSHLIPMNTNFAGENRTWSHDREKKRAIILPQESRKVFITHSSDLSSEMPRFIDFLTKQGFRVSADLFENSIRTMNIHDWNDSYVRDPSVLIIVAVSPKYKADIEGSVMNSYSLHTKYIHSMMQNEFIQQGSLNFRFIPVLFFSASQKHVPGWLQNTHVYRWPHHMQDLLLRLLMQERFLPPPVPRKPTLITMPVAMSAADTQ